MISSIPIAVSITITHMVSFTTLGVAFIILTAALSIAATALCSPFWIIISLMPFFTIEKFM
ncbi:hypothetical protein PGTUg99_024792 [Puccinia graminis f. sp. tritici]|uniref:Uncharacterized protein n=1 Tax=Puccinia graminis f. sp. tritici TaxID=56615 RepID=A0A5B0R8E3_PUCGR|nr:hypothetical protein PGTUg99_024792 [Puccinia graminis f. sp. tritici]